MFFRRLIISAIVTCLTLAELGDTLYQVRQLEISFSFPMTKCPDDSLSHELGLGILAPYIAYYSLQELFHYKADVFTVQDHDCASYHVFLASLDS